MGMSDEEAAWEQAREEFEKEVGERVLGELQENALNYYFHMYGGDIHQRISCRIQASRTLVKHKLYGESLTCSVTAAELTIRWVLLRPLSQAVFLSDDVADVLMDRILPPRNSSTDRDILPDVLSHWGMDVKALSTSDGKNLWTQLTKEFIPLRNDVIHKGHEVSLDVARRASHLCEELYKAAGEFIAPIAGLGKKGMAGLLRRASIMDVK